MNAGMIQHHDRLPRKVTQQVKEELNHIPSSDRASLGVLKKSLA
ncbi:MAG: hypothetical protein JWQ08_1141 [Deinococcus sp.]|jgi:hypothetical protein|nr:hypothetical protein [Deinococcus sp.]